MRQCVCVYIWEDILLCLEAIVCADHMLFCTFVTCALCRLCSHCSRYSFPLPLQCGLWLDPLCYTLFALLATTSLLPLLHCLLPSYLSLLYVSPPVAPSLIPFFLLWEGGLGGLVCVPSPCPHCGRRRRRRRNHACTFSVCLPILLLTACLCVTLQQHSFFPYVYISLCVSFTIVALCIIVAMCYYSVLLNSSSLLSHLPTWHCVPCAPCLPSSREEEEGSFLCLWPLCPPPVCSCLCCVWPCVYCMSSLCACLPACLLLLWSPVCLFPFCQQFLPSIHSICLPTLSCLYKLVNQLFSSFFFFCICSVFVQEPSVLPLFCLVFSVCSCMLPSSHAYHHTNLFSPPSSLPWLWGRWARCLLLPFHCVLFITFVIPSCVCVAFAFAMPFQPDFTFNFVHPTHASCIPLWDWTLVGWFGLCLLCV